MRKLSNDEINTKPNKFKKHCIIFINSQFILETLSVNNNVLAECVNEKLKDDNDKNTFY